MTTNKPRDQVDRLDAIDCEATGTHRVGDRVTCDTHQLEVARAMWNTDPRYPMREVDAAENFHCGDAYTSSAVTR